jgi:hypothetical protein
MWGKAYQNNELKGLQLSWSMKIQNELVYFFKKKRTTKKEK